MLIRMQINQITHVSLVRMYNAPATLEDILAISLKSNHATSLQSSNCTLQHLTQRNKNLTQKLIH